MNAKAELERANEDIAIRKLQAQAKMDTERMITGVKVFIISFLSIIINSLIIIIHRLLLIKLCD
jgi:hypothetical protein